MWSTLHWINFAVTVCYGNKTVISVVLIVLKVQINNYWNRLQHKHGIILEKFIKPKNDRQNKIDKI